MKNPTEFGPKGRSGGKDLLKGRDVKYIYSRLFMYLAHYKGRLFLAVFFSALSAILGISGTSLAGSAIGAISGESEHGVPYYLILMIVFYSLSVLISYCLSVLMISLSQKICNKMRTDVYNNLIKLPVGFFDRKQAGELVSIISYDINTINETLSNDFLQIVSSIVTVVY